MKRLILIWPFYLLPILLIAVSNDAATPKERRCGNEQCSDVISFAKTLVRYSSPQIDRVSFVKGMQVEVLSKSPDLWEVRVGGKDGKRGYVPAGLLREYKVVLGNDKLLTVTSESSVPDPIQVEHAQIDMEEATKKLASELPTHGIGSILTFPSMASAQAAQAQEGSGPSPPSPQYEVIDGTTVFMDPVATISDTQPSVFYPPEGAEIGKDANDPQDPQLPERKPMENQLPVGTPNEASQTLGAVPHDEGAKSVPSTEQVEQVETEVLSVNAAGAIPSTETTEAPPPVELTGAAPPSDATEAIPLVEQTTGAPDATEAPPPRENQGEEFGEVTVETVSEPAVPEDADISPEMTTETATEAQDIQPSKAEDSVLHNIWSTMFSSGDGTEEQSQENEGEDEAEDGDEEDETEEEETEDYSTEATESTEPTTVSEVVPAEASLSQDPSDTPVDLPPTTESPLIPTGNAESAQPGVLPTPVPDTAFVKLPEYSFPFPSGSSEDIGDQIRPTRQASNMNGGNNFNNNLNNNGNGNNNFNRGNGNNNNVNRNNLNGNNNGGNNNNFNSGNNNGGNNNNFNNGNNNGGNNKNVNNGNNNGGNNNNFNNGNNNGGNNNNFNSGNNNFNSNNNRNGNNNGNGNNLNNNNFNSNNNRNGNNNGNGNNLNNNNFHSGNSNNVNKNNFNNGNSNSNANNNNNLNNGNNNANNKNNFNNGNSNNNVNSNVGNNNFNMNNKNLNNNDNVNVNSAQGNQMDNGQNIVQSQQSRQENQQQLEKQRQEEEAEKQRKLELEREAENKRRLELENEMIRKNLEKQRLAEEEEEKRKAEEEEKKQRAEEERKFLEEEKRRAEEEQRLAEEEQRLADEERKRAEEEQKLRQVKEDEEKAKAEEELNQNNQEQQQLDEPVQEQAQASDSMFSWVSGLFGGEEAPIPEPDPASQAPTTETPAAVSLDTPVISSDIPPPLSPVPASPESQVDSSAGLPPSPPPPPTTSPYYHEHPPAWGAAEPQGVCSATSDPNCQMNEKQENAEGLLLAGLTPPSLDALLIRLAATAFTLFMGVFALYFLQKKRVDSSLVARINELEKQLLVASKEAIILQETAATSTAQVDSGEISALEEELESARLARVDLEEQVATLERELEEATETGIELNRLLSETLEASKGKAHAGLAASVERLQQQLDGQREKVDSLTRSLASTSAENETLKSALAESKEKTSALEAELAAAADVAVNIRREREEADVLAAQKLNQMQSQLEEALSSKVLQESRLASELSALKLSHEKIRASLATRDAEVEALQDTVKNLETKSERADQLLDFARLRAELEQAKQDRDTCKETLDKEEVARQRLEQHVKGIEEEAARLRGEVEETQKDKLEAETRLTVLSNYFKEKEAQLQKELGLQEAIVAQHRGDESTVVKHLQSLQEEVDTYRSQIESLKKEILDQERDFKGQIASLEKKAHDNWVAARQAERRLEESRQDAALLRNRLTLVEKSNDPNSRLETNGEGGVASPVMMGLPPLGDMETPPPLPPFMFSPPPYPPPFMPPPPPHGHPMGRPPPLGRMSSPPPPPIGQFSPPPIPYDRIDRSSRSPSPPPHYYHHRSPPPHHHWDDPRSSFRPVPKPSPKKPQERRDHKGSALSSGHSNESLEKSRHSDRDRERV